MELLGISELRFNDDWLQQSHAHASSHEMILILTGRIEVVTRGERVVGDAGSVLLYPCGVPHEERSVGSPLTMICLGWSDDEAHDDLARVVADRRHRIAMLFRWLMQPSGRQVAASLMHLILAEYRDGSRGAQNELTAAIREYVQAHLTERITLEELAQIACLSKYRFAHVFEQQTGMPPMKFVRRMRLEAARTLLLITNLPQSAVAEAVGFRDETQLSRVWRQMLDSTPGQLRANGKVSR